MLPSERIILRVWLEEIDACQPVKGDGTVVRMRHTAERCGVDYGRVVNLVRGTSYKEMQSCSA